MGKFIATEKWLEIESTLLGFSQQMFCHLDSALFMLSNQHHMKAFGKPSFQTVSLVICQKFSVKKYHPGLDLVKIMVLISALHSLSNKWPFVSISSLLIFCSFLPIDNFFLTLILLSISFPAYFPKPDFKGVASLDVHHCPEPEWDLASR